ELPSREQPSHEPRDRRYAADSPAVLFRVHGQEPGSITSLRRPPMEASEPQPAPCGSPSFNSCLDATRRRGQRTVCARSRVRVANSIAVATLATALAITRGYPLGARLVPMPYVPIEAAGHFGNGGGRSC